MTKLNNAFVLRLETSLKVRDKVKLAMVSNTGLKYNLKTVLRITLLKLNFVGHYV